MKLIAYLREGRQVDIRPAPVERAWMDASDQRFAYRCLPLNIANGMGWELLCPSGFAAAWDGGQGNEAIQIHADAGTTPPAVSHFRHGILTFHVSCLFRTDPGYDLVAQGPINRPKDGISPLTGVIETDWAPYGFTMNWIFTRPGAAVRFEHGEPFCHVFPMRRGDLETIEPEMRPLDADPDLARRYNTWIASRGEFNKELTEPGSRAQSQKWQKQYYRGVDPSGQSAAADGHRTRMRLKPFQGLEQWTRKAGPEDAKAELLEPEQASQTAVPAVTDPSRAARPDLPAAHRETVHTFWSGEPLNAYQLLCLRSFVDRGHHILLFSYDPSLALPAWIERRDAADILPPERVLRRRSAPGEEGFATHVNLFRYALLHRFGGWWADLDVISLKPSLPQEQLFFAASGERDFVSLGFVKIPRGHPLLTEAVERAAALDISLWPQSGSPLFTQLLARHGLMRHCRSQEEACPIPWFELEVLFDPSRFEEARRRCANAYVVELHDEFWRGAGIPHRLGPPGGSLLDVLARQHEHGLGFAARMEYADVACWIKHLRENIGLDARLRLIEASHREFKARCEALERERNALPAAD
jgi:Family of unknown function (DUF6065)